MAATAKVLVVDDDPDIVETIRMVLENSGYEVTAANSASEALADLATSRPDLILLDVMMPDGTEGFQFVWKLRNEFPPELSEVPILILSAIHDTTKLRFYPSRTDGTYKPGEFLPVQGFMDKPVEPGTLLQKIKEVLPPKA